ncbi:P-loop containing nucleoside triphosphate hydrolase protein [Fusarium tricinctum]|uniref:P-loop containing nucleoside triphosphate hydrolase protein n=1 Tax=Fusarium tricinctum TaxID=61284 RepID=A0A8K0RK25_9HYPO|nr:P-loop containing nucleoside triphosphate hydrolase protein [Fusarium tricinctum]
MTETAGPDVAETGSSPKCTIHQVKCPGSSPAHSRHPAIASFLDVPRLFLGDNKASPLRGRDSGERTKLKTKLDPDIPFVIYRTYNCLEYHASIFAVLEKAPSGVSVLAKDAPEAVPELEHMEIVSSHLSDAIEEVKSRDSHCVDEFQPKSLLLGWRREQSLVAPYLHFYYARDLLAKHKSRSQSQKRHINLLLKYLSSKFGDEFKEAEDLFSKGLVTRKHFHKLFGPREVLATTNGSGQHIAMVSRYPPLPGSDPIRVECEIMDFNGKFVKYKRTVTIHWPKNLSESDVVSIGSLNAFPIRFDRLLEDRLRQRGEFFWKLRKRKLIQYTAPDEVLEYRMQNGRYMVDVETYHRSCGESKPEDPNTDEFVEQFRPLDSGNFTAPPPEEFFLLMPPTIYGFGFHDKQWRKLDVGFATEITWNDRAFKKLVLPQEEKDMLSASVLKSTASDGLKIVSGRGPGVVILLHGGPGTGKTFAAEALAELSRRPLYRLTSSDIDTSPREVEYNLNQAFYLGGVWDAIMLLDECDVYLETGRQTDFSRNAIVSIILHVLDYHQGISILTSRGYDLNPALQPRVHVTCTFKLDDDERKTVWRRTMKAFNLHVNEDGRPHTTDDILESILKQDSSTLSVREIRNVIQTATNLATKENRRANASDIGMAINMIQRNRRLY